MNAPGAQRAAGERPAGSRRSRTPAKAPRTVAGRMLQALAEAGSSPAFGLPGVHNLAFWGEAPGPELAAVVNVRHEQTAVYAADGYARATGRVGCALVTTGPGAANALGAFGEAAASKSPLVLVASEVPRRVTETGIRGALHQSRDQAGMFRPLAKAVFTPRTPEEAVAAFVQALEVAQTAPQGPVYLDVPSDVLGLPADAVASRPRPSASEGDSDALHRAAELIDGATSVAIWAGGGVVQAEAGTALESLAHHLRAPVFTTFSGRGAVGPGYFGTVRYPPHEQAVGAVLEAADLLVVVGSDLDGMTTKNHTLSLPSRMVAVNVDPSVTSYPGSEVLTVVGDAKWALERLHKLTTGRRDGLASGVRLACDTAWRTVRTDERTAEAAELVELVQRVAFGRALVVADMTKPGYWLGGYYVPAGPRCLQYPMGWGTLGYALPASVGAAYGADGPVLAVVGDGGIAFALGELATLVQEQLDVTVLVFEDGGYGMLAFDQDRAGEPHRGVDLVNPDFVALAAAFGLPAVSVEGVGPELEEVLDKALSNGGPHLVRCAASLYPPRTTSPRWNED